MSCRSLELQSRALRLAALRSPDSYVAGGVALNREGPRYSGDIDIFQDSEERLAAAAEADANALADAGLNAAARRIRTGKQEAEIQALGERTLSHGWPWRPRTGVNLATSSIW